MVENLREKLYQMFILGMDGTKLKDNLNLVDALHNGLGGMIFFTQNIQTTQQFKKLIQDIKTEAKTSLFLSIDEEGGRVERTENLFGGKKFLSAKFAVEKGEEFLREQTEQISHLLKDLGLNLNFAPVLDVNTNPNNPIIGERAFSDNVNQVIKFGKIVVETYLKSGILTCTKHFPGHGEASADSHISLPKIDLSFEELKKYHIKPFKEVDSPMMMVAHLHCSAFDEEVIPSSLSKNVIGYLREKLRYNGVVVTDDMVMGAMENRNSKNSSQSTVNCALAIKAGVNILLYRNSYDETIQIIEELVELAKKDEVLKEKIDESFDKIIKLKNDFNI